MMHLVPDGEADIAPIKCEAEAKQIRPHTTWTFVVLNRCTEHEHPKTYIVIRECGNCGTWTEWVQVSGEQGGVFQMTLSPAEVARFTAGL
jgi:hypothetical protein